jgi:hypothetical protein
MLAQNQGKRWAQVYHAMARRKVSTLSSCLLYHKIPLRVCFCVYTPLAR